MTNKYWNNTEKQVPSCCFQSLHNLDYKKARFSLPVVGVNDDGKVVEVVFVKFEDYSAFFTDFKSFLQNGHNMFSCNNMFYPEFWIKYPLTEDHDEELW